VDAAMERIGDMFHQDESSVPLRFVVVINGEFIGPIETMDYLVVNDKVETDESNTTNGPAALPIQSEFKGTMTRDANGGGQITATAMIPDNGPAGTIFECPDRKYRQVVNLNLSARPKQKGE
jgi:hypothetical protein